MDYTQLSSSLLNLNIHRQIYTDIHINRVYIHPYVHVHKKTYIPDIPTSTAIHNIDTSPYTHIYTNRGVYRHT